MSGTTQTAFDRDSLARWYASRHFQTDAGVQRIFYLPTNSPPRQIRLLEVNRMISETTPLEAIDFGVDVGGAEGHTLFVLDVTPTQWDAIQKGDLALPVDWTLTGSTELSPRSNGS
jgi:hypothetical protein